MSKRLIFLLSIVFAFLALYLLEIYYIQPANIWKGVPIVKQDKSNGWLRVFRNQAYMLGYSEKKANALWVSYLVKPRPKPSLYSKRPSTYPRDWRSVTGVKQSDYKKTGYDRGHLAPNYVIGSRYGRKAQKETFLMTNITPQKPKLNRKLWQRIEELVANDFSKKWQKLWVITGPIFSQPVKFLKNTTIQIPSAFYKIIIRADENLEKVHSLAFIVPQNVIGTESLMDFVVTIDEVENKTGLDFFWQLPDNYEEQFEKNKDTYFWSLNKVAKRPPRY